MSGFLGFLLEASLAMALLYGLYYWLMRRETFYLGSRIILLAALVVPLWVPLISIRLQNPLPLPAFSTMLDAVVLRPPGNAAMLSAQTGAGPPWLWLLAGVYGLGSAIAGGFMLKRLVFAVRLLCKSYPEVTIAHTRVKLLPQSRQAFSFFGMVFLGDQVPAEARETIVLHERGHARQFHSADKLLGELLQVVFWFHPVVYFINRELTAIHEYAADHHIRDTYDPQYYQELLLRQSPAAPFILSNAFHQSLTLKRLIMMHNQKSPKTGRKRFALAWVLLAGLMLPFACTETQQTKPEKQAAEQKAHEKIAIKAEEMPQFPGGKAAMQKFLMNHIEYPEKAREQDIEGKVFVRFAIMKTGEVAHIEIAKGAHKLLNRAAQNVVSAMPDWEPGRQDGKPVHVWFTLPIRFALNDKQESKAGS